MKNIFREQWLVIIIFFLFSCDRKDNNDIPPGYVQLIRSGIGSVYLDLTRNVTDVPVDKNIVIEFSTQLDTTTVGRSISLLKNGTSQVFLSIHYMDNFMTLILEPGNELEHSISYTLGITSSLKGINSETFPGVTYTFTTVNGTMVINNITLNGQSFLPPSIPRNISLSSNTITVDFSEALDPDNFISNFIFSGPVEPVLELSDGNRRVTLKDFGDLEYYRRYFLTISSALTAANGYRFDGFTNSFYTGLDSTYKFPLLSDAELLDLVQRQIFKYFYDFAHPVSGFARERNTSGDLVTTGGSGFGVMALIIGIERGYITREQGLIQIGKILNFLETCDRFHGVWPHWLNGVTGSIVPFSAIDDGGDLVESSFMVQGLIAFRQYLDPGIPAEQLLTERIDELYRAVEFDFFTQGRNTLYWHWSPHYGFQINMPLRGYNETFICYVLGSGSPVHSISREVYQSGYMDNGLILNGNSYYGVTLPMGEPYGGPLFFTHYSFLGLDPRRLEDIFVNYWDQNVAHSLINWKYCEADPKDYIGYSNVCWGLTASDNQFGYSAHSPTNDPGVISPTAAISSMPYTPVQSMDALRHFYYILGDRLWGPFGFYDAFNATAGWWATSNIAIDQGPMIIMIENYRTGLIWDLFMSNSDIKNGLNKLGFTY